jgi:hypothetical protein
MTLSLLTACGTTPPANPQVTNDSPSFRTQQVPGLAGASGLGGYGMAGVPGLGGYGMPGAAGLGGYGMASGYGAAASPWGSSFNPWSSMARYGSGYGQFGQSPWGMGGWGSQAAYGNWGQAPWGQQGWNNASPWGNAAGQLNPQMLSMMMSSMRNGQNPNLMAGLGGGMPTRSILGAR